MWHHAKFKPGLVVQPELVDDVGTGAVIAGNFDDATLAAQSGDDLVEGADPRNVPEMRCRNVDEDVRRIFVDLEASSEAIDRGEENLAGDEIGGAALIGIELASHLEHALHLGSEEDAGQQHAGEHAQREVVRCDDDDDCRHHDDRGGRGMAA